MARNAAHFHVALHRFLATRLGCRSSVVEHSLGKGEVLSSILSGSTTPFLLDEFRDARHDQSLGRERSIDRAELEFRVDQILQLAP